MSCCDQTRLPFSPSRSPVHGAKASTRILKPPPTMRLQSKGIDFGSVMVASRGSFIPFALTRSRCARDLYTIHEKTTG